jgi:hypothetical protein
MNDQIEITTSVKNDTSETFKLFCNECKTKTFHISRTYVKYSWDHKLVPMGGWSKNYTVECRGCKSISFYKEGYFSENDYDYDEYGEPIIERYQYPEPVYSIRVELMDEDNLPELVRKIYMETHMAFTKELNVLATVGIRSILESVCIDIKAKGDNLVEKIKDMVKQGLITESSSEMLHKVRLIGNKAVHEIDSLSAEELKAALDVLDHLLLGVYIIPGRAELLTREK